MFVGLGCGSGENNVAIMKQYFKTASKNKWSQMDAGRKNDLKHI